MNATIHNTIVEMLQRNNWNVLLEGFMNALADKDAGIRRIMNILAATQEIKLERKDELRKQLRAWYRINYGDRKFFADSDLNRKHKQNDGKRRNHLGQYA